MSCLFGMYISLQDQLMMQERANRRAAAAAAITSSAQNAAMQQQQLQFQRPKTTLNEATKSATLDPMDDFNNGYGTVKGANLARQ